MGLPDRAVKRFERKACPVIRVERLESDALRCLMTLIYPGFLGQRILQRLGVVRAGQRPEEWHGDARRPIARRLDVDEVDCERVARLGALDIEGPRLWIDIWVLTDLAEQILL